MTRASTVTDLVLPPAGTRPRVLTGDTPTGRLHLGHYVGSIERRLAMQAPYECYFLIANMHAFTTRAEKPAEIRESTLEIVKDWLACGIDPTRSKVVLQTEVPAIAELSWFFAMLIPFNRVMNNPTIKTEIDAKGLGDSYPFGFPLYAVGQCADILAFRPVFIPVGEDQVPHIELCRFVAGKFNQVYCGVNNRTPDDEHEKAGGVFPIPRAMIGRIARLPGIDGTQKMSKSDPSDMSRINMTDDADTILRLQGQRLMWGTDHFEGRAATKTSLESITIDDMRAFHAKVYHPGNLVIGVTGETVKSRLASVAGASKATIVREDGGSVWARAYPAEGSVNGTLARGIADVCVKENWKFEELHTEEGRLDEVFRDITWSETARKENK